MGIRDINTTLKSAYSYKQCRLDAFKGRAVAIDFGTWMFKYWIPAAERVINKTNLITSDPDPREIRATWFSFSQMGIKRFLSNGVLPVFVFDGPSPMEKDGEKSKRIAEKMKSKVAYEKMITEARSSYDLLDNAKDMASLRKACMKAYSIPSEEYDNIMYLLDAMGFCTFKPNCEAEKFCSMLCHDGYVSAVYSSDTDNLAYGCPLWISDIEEGIDSNGLYSTIAHYIHYGEMLQFLGVSKEFFTDLCIIHGCDYNNRIKGYGPVKATQLMTRYGNLDNISTIMDTSSLKHGVCRGLFSYCSSSQLVDIPIAITYKTIDPDVLHYNLSLFEGNEFYNDIRNGIEYCKDCTNELLNNGAQK